jgi:hypothetical protein
MQGMVDNVIGAINDRINNVTGQITAGVDAVKDWGTQAAKAVNEISATISDPSKAIAELQNRIPVPGAVAWAAQFAGIFGFSAPGIGGGGSPKRPRDVNYLTKQAIGENINSLLQLNDLHQTGGDLFQGISDKISGFHGVDVSTDEGLGKALKSVMGMKDSILSDQVFAQTVKKVASDMSAEGLAQAAQRTVPEAIEHLSQGAAQGTGFALPSAAGGSDSTQRLSDLYRLPEEEQRFSPLRDIPGSTPEIEQVIRPAPLFPAVTSADIRAAREALDSVQPASTSTRLSDLYNIPTADTNLSAAASSQPGQKLANLAAQQPGNDDAFARLSTSEGRDAASVAFEARLNAARQGQSEVVVEPAPTPHRREEGFIPSRPGSIEALAGREGREEELADRSIAAVEEKQLIPPPWLQDFIAKYGQLR